MLALVLAAFVLMSATFVVTLAAFVLMGAFVSAFAAGLLTGLHFAAILGTFVDTGLAIVGSAGGVGTGALVVALVFADFGLDNGVGGLFRSVVVASGHAESESGSDKSS